MRLRTRYLQEGHQRFGNVRRFGLDHFVDNAVLHSLLRCHEEIPITIFFHFIFGLSSVFRNVCIQDFPDKENFLGL